MACTSVVCRSLGSIPGVEDIWRSLACAFEHVPPIQSTHRYPLNVTSLAATRVWLTAPSRLRVEAWLSISFYYAHESSCWKFDDASSFGTPPVFRDIRPSCYLRH